MYSNNDPISNNLGNTGSRLRTPRGFVAINGEQVEWLNFNVSNTRYGSAGTFSVSVPVSTLPKTLSLDSLLRVTPVAVQINAGNANTTRPNEASASDMPLVISGNADSITYDPRQSLVTLAGRDYISLFIENNIYAPSYGVSSVAQIDLSSIMGTQQLSSDIIKYIATFRGLKANVIKTKTPIGYFMKDPNFSVMLNSNITEWDLMTLLARQEGLDLYIIGNTLFLQKASTDTPFKITITTPFFTDKGHIPQANVTNIQLKRNLRLAKDIIVNVFSRDIFNETNIQASASLSHQESQASTANSSVYNFVYPNINVQQAEKRAQSLLAEISQHEMEIQFSMPDENSINAHSVILIVGTNSMYDQKYYVKNVTREMDVNSGFNLTVSAVNQSPNTVTIQSTSVPVPQKA